MIYLQVAAGLAVLLVGGDLLVRGAIGISERFGISPLVIGVTVVAFGTSAPELVVCVEAALTGQPDLAIGNVVGSNIANVLLVLGLSALVYPIFCNPEGLRRDSTLMLIASVFFATIAWGRLFERWQGGMLLALLVVFLAYSYVRAVRQGEGASEDHGLEYEGIKAMPRVTSVSLVLVVGGCVGLALGSHILINGATEVARAIGVSETVIGLTLVAVGTSLPELATSMVAAVRRHGEVALGNVLGSNMFNLLGIMGVTALAAPIPVPSEILSFDIWIMLGVALLLGSFTLRCAPIGRVVGLLFVIAYSAYLVAQFNGLSGIVVAAG
ncbi:MAG: calcium/sodium antiporter [Alphaproteobacteria bacterium]